MAVESAETPKEKQTSQTKGPVTKEMRLDLEYKFRELSFAQQSNFLMHLRCNVKNGYDYYRWVQMGVAKVDFDRLPDEAIECMFQYLRDNDLMDTERVAAKRVMDLFLEGLWSEHRNVMGD